MFSLPHMGLSLLINALHDLPAKAFTKEKDVNLKIADEASFYSGKVSKEMRGA